MRDKLDYKLAIGLIVAVVLMLIGYILWEDFSLEPEVANLTIDEIIILQSQTETSLLTTIGGVFLNAGFIGGAICLGALVIRQILAYFKRKRF